MLKIIQVMMDDKDNRLDKEALEKMSGDIVNYLLHDYPEYFSIQYNYDDNDGEETELEGIELNTRIHYI